MPEVRSRPNKPIRWEWLGRFTQFFRFGIVGTFGFVADAAALKCLLWLGADLFWGRIGSYLFAVTVTWSLNRHYTFSAYQSDCSRFKEWARFTLSQCTGATINIGVYSWLVFTSDFFAATPVLAVAIGSLAGMAINFLVACVYVYPRTNAGEVSGGDIRR